MVVTIYLIFYIQNFLKTNKNSNLWKIKSCNIVAQVGRMINCPMMIWSLITNWVRESLQILDTWLKKSLQSMSKHSWIITYHISQGLQFLKFQNRNEEAKLISNNRDWVPLLLVINFSWLYLPFPNSLTKDWTSDWWGDRLLVQRITVISQFYFWWYK